MNISISHAGSKARDTGDSKNHVLSHPYACLGPIDTSLQKRPWTGHRTPKPAVFLFPWAVCKPRSKPHIESSRHLFPRGSKCQNVEVLGPEHHESCLCVVHLAAKSQPTAEYWKPQKGSQTLYLKWLWGLIPSYLRTWTATMLNKNMLLNLFLAAGPQGIRNLGICSADAACLFDLNTAPSSRHSMPLPHAVQKSKWLLAEGLERFEQQGTCALERKLHHTLTNVGI